MNRLRSTLLVLAILCYAFIGLRPGVISLAGAFHSAPQFQAQPKAVRQAVYEDIRNHGFSRGGPVLIEGQQQIRSLLIVYVEQYPVPGLAELRAYAYWWDGESWVYVEDWHEG